MDENCNGPIQVNGRGDAAGAFDFRRHLISAGCDIREAMIAINALRGVPLTLFVTDRDGKVTGSVTDGDIRRSLIAGNAVSSSVVSAMNRNFIALRPSDDSERMLRLARRRGASLLPRLDEEGRAVGIVNLNVTHAILPLDAVLMAGGRGERLRPLTLTTPKPLLKIGDKAIIDYNIDELRANGITNIFVTVNYLKEQIIEHFSDGRAICVEEPRRLGTMGSLSLVEGLKHDNLILMNSDLLTDLDFAELYHRHIDTGAALTMATTPYSVSVPFALTRTEGDMVTGLEEKPSFNYLANAGVYMMRRELLSRIRRGEYLDAPDFIASLIADGLKVSFFVITGTWIDIGSPQDYKYASDMMRRMKNF